MRLILRDVIGRVTDKLNYSKSKFEAQALHIEELERQLEGYRRILARRIGRRPLLGWRRHTSLDPIATGGLVAGGGRGCWTSTTRDPKLLLPFACRAAVLQIKFRARFDGRAAAISAKWQVFLDYGEGFSERDSHTVHFRAAEIEVDVTLALRRPIVQVRIDPIDAVCRVTIERLELVEWSFIAGIWRSVQLRQARARLFERDAYREAWAALRRLMPRKALATFLEARGQQGDPYQQWIAAREVTDARHAAFVAKGATLGRRPFFSIIMPTYESPLRFLELAIDSIRRQTYPHWELCVTDDGSKNPEVVALLRRMADADARIRLEVLAENAGISAASNAALARAKGEYIVLVDHDDEIAPHALFAMAAAIAADPDADWLYSDEDKIDETGQRFAPFFKPDWCPTYFLSLMYTCHLGVYRRALVQRLGGFRSDFDLAQDYDLALRIASVSKNVVHVSDVLYHWRTLAASTASGADAKPRAEMVARRAVQELVDRSGFAGACLPGLLPGLHKVEFDVAGRPVVSIVVPTAGRRSGDDEAAWYIGDLVRSIRETTTYAAYEIIVIDNGDLDPVLIETLEALGVARVTYASTAFNLSEKINLGVAAAAGDYVAILNDDMRIINGGWLQAMLSWCQLPDVAAVGGKLLLPNDLVQHAGVLLFEQGPSHVHYMHAADEVGLVASAITCREYSAVTGACLMTRTEDYRAIGGFDLAYPLNYNDIDFCLRLTDHTKGRILVCPDALLYHFESVSKDDNPTVDLERFNAQWAHRRGRDPFYNRHLSQVSSAWELDQNILTLEAQYELPTDRAHRSEAMPIRRPVL